MPHFCTRLRRIGLPSLLLALAFAWAAPARPAGAELPAGTVEPIYRVAHEEPAAELAARVVPTSPPSPFNLAQNPGEHPLMPAMRVAQDGLAYIDQNIHDYQAILFKQERINGELQEQEVAYIKVRHKPFSVHMFFLAPSKGRECLYVEGPAGTNGELLARDC
jgi:hypothetical protein